MEYERIIFNPCCQGPIIAFTGGAGLFGSVASCFTSPLFPDSESLVRKHPGAIFRGNYSLVGLLVRRGECWKAALYAAVPYERPEQAGRWYADRCNSTLFNHARTCCRARGEVGGERAPAKHISTRRMKQRSTTISKWKRISPMSSDPPRTLYAHALLFLIACDYGKLKSQNRPKRPPLTNVITNCQPSAPPGLEQS
jgi:hypothetical protein